MRLTPRYLGSILVLAGLYLIAAKLGLSLAFSVKQITTVWPPSGLALAALILYGFDLWPGIFLGALLANLLTSAPLPVAAGIAVGNTLEAVLGTYLLRRVIHFRPALNRVRGVIGLAFLAAFFSTMVAATIGTISLSLGGLLATTSAPTAWVLWWFGDMAGVLLFAPVILVWRNGWRQINHQNFAEFGSLLVGTAVVAAAIFFGQFTFLGNHPQVSYFIFPFIIWAAFRFKQLGVTAVSIITSIIAILGTASGEGPFAGAGSSEQQLITLLVYIILLSASGLFMAVAVLQREASEQQLLRQTKELKAARNKILQELNDKKERESHLQESNERITGILARLMDETPERSSREL
ncbi:MAG TPA: MASE1 domain-containing protein [Candidatus Saccharimonadales bacterium]|nr:MASE1 domain-containing protein [Candidatus Saccharimonadales bacterium]